MAVGDTRVSWLFHTSTNTTFLSKATDYFYHMLPQSLDTKYAGKKVRLNQGSNSQPPGHESDPLITEPAGRGYWWNRHTHNLVNQSNDITEILLKEKENID